MFQDGCRDRWKPWACPSSRSRLSVAETARSSRPYANQLQVLICPREQYDESGEMDQYVPRKIYTAACPAKTCGFSVRTFERGGSEDVDMERGFSVLKLSQADSEQQRIAPIDDLEEMIDFKS